MSGLSVPQMARELVEGNRRVADSVEAELSPGGRPEDLASRRRRGARAARQLTRFTLNRSSDTRDVWRAELEVMEDGVGNEEAKELARIALATMDSWLALTRKTRELWRGVEADTGATPEGLDQLAAAEAEVRELRAAAEKVDLFLARARAPVDSTRLRQGREDAEQGRLKKSEEMLSRFQGPPT
jgi:hypothetical protein